MIHQAEKGFMHQRRGLEGVTPPLTAHLLARHPAQFLVNGYSNLHPQLSQRLENAVFFYQSFA